MKKLKKIFEIPSLIMENISCVIIFLVSGVTLINVITRAAFKTPIYGAVELVQYSVLLAMCLALPAMTIKGGHASVTIVVDILPFGVKKAFKVVTRLVSIVLFTILSKNLLTPMADSMRKGRTTDVFKIPFYLVQGAIFVGLALMVLVLVYMLIEAVAEKKDDVSAPGDDPAI